MSAIPLVIWLPEPIATARRARFRAGTSLTPSPIIAVKRPRSASTETSAFFCSGTDSAEDRVLRRRPAERDMVLGELVALDNPGVRGDPDRGRHRGHRLPGVARDQLQVHLLLAHEGDRLLGVGAEGLLEHDQGQRGDRRRRLGVGVRREACRWRDRRRPPGARSRVCSSRALLEGRRQLQRPARREHVGGAEHEGLAAAAPVQGEPAPLPLGGERHLGGDPLPGRRVLLGDRLEGPVALARAAGEAGERLVGVPRVRLVGDLHRDQLQLAGGQGPGLVDADRVDGRQGLGGAHLLDEGVEAGEADGRDRQGDAHQQHQALRDQGDQPRGRRLRRLARRLVAGVEGEDQDDGERQHQPGGRPEDAVHLLLQRARAGGGRRGPRPRPSRRRSPRGPRRPRSSPIPRARTTPRAPAGRPACAPRRPRR